MKDLSSGPEGSSNEFQETTKEQVKTEGKQNSTHKAGSQLLPKQWMAQMITLPAISTTVITKPWNKTSTNECKDIGNLLM